MELTAFTRILKFNYYCITHPNYIYQRATDFRLIAFICKINICISPFTLINLYDSYSRLTP